MLPTTTLRLTRSAPAVSRRGLLEGLATLGLVIGFAGPTGRLASAATAEAAASPFQGYVQIAPDDTVTVWSAHMDMGQGCYTGTATLVAEELGCDWAKVRVEGGWGNPKLYGNLAWGGAVQGTGGSTAMASSWERYRTAGAAARLMLAEAAARRWGVPAAEVTVANGVLSHGDRTLRMGEVAAEAATLPVPSEVPLKPSGQWTLIGDPALRRLDSAAKSTGRQTFTIDVRLPGMLVAVVAHPPRFGGVARSFDATAAKAVPGVVDVVAIPRGVAVVAETTWAAMKGREALTVDWDESAAESRGTAELLALYKAALDRPDAAVAASVGDAPAALAAAGSKVIEAEFEFPYLAHAAMEPLDAVAWKNGETVEIWGGHQMPDLYQMIAAEVAGTTPDTIRLHVMMTGGGFGRRAVTDADVIVEAVATARAIGWKAPVKVMWTREDDMRGGRYRPMYLHRLRAALDGSGRITAWQHRIVGQSILRGTPFEGFLAQNGVDATSVEGATRLPYALPSFQVDLVTTDVGVPVLWWRAVGSTHTAFSTEVFVDELAAAAGQDPMAFRLAHLDPKHSRHEAALLAVRDASGWGTPAPAGRFRGVAVAESFGSVVAQVAEVSVTAGSVRVHRVWCAVDCGTAINPDIVKAQMEGGIGFGLGAILKDQITLAAGIVQETNFDSYESLRIDEMPEVQVTILPSTSAPTGVGEPGVPPIGPAVANAIRAATGRSIRVLPIARNDLTSV